MLEVCFSTPSLRASTTEIHHVNQKISQEHTNFDGNTINWFHNLIRRQSVNLLQDKVTQLGVIPMSLMRQNADQKLYILTYRVKIDRQIDSWETENKLNSFKGSPNLFVQNPWNRNKKLTVEMYYFLSRYVTWTFS